MASLEKKQVVVEKMIGKLSGAKDENAKKYFGCNSFGCVRCQHS